MDADRQTHERHFESCAILRSRSGRSSAIRMRNTKDTFIGFYDLRRKRDATFIELIVRWTLFRLRPIVGSITAEADRIMASALAAAAVLIAITNVSVIDVRTGVVSAGRTVVINESQPCCSQA